MAAPLSLGFSPPQRALVGALFAACCGFAALIALEWTMPDETPAADAALSAGDAAQAAAAPKSFVLAPLQSFSAVAERPLFAPDRRPPPQAAADSLGAWSALVLAGIVITPSSRQALIAHGNPPSIVHLEEGQTVDGWTVQSIAADRIVVANGGEKHELRLIDHTQPNPPTPVVPIRNGRAGG